MKECYFTPETIDKKANEMLQKLMPFRKYHPFNFMPQQSALVVIDMQRYFLNEQSPAYLPGAQAIIPKIKILAGEYRRHRLPMILTQHINNQENAKRLLSWWDDVITQDNSLSEIIPDFLYPDIPILRKTQYDAFYETPLESLLKERSVTQLVITGVMTHLCCETTARAAFVRGFDVFFTIDGTATQNEEFHRSTLLNLSHGFAIPVLTDEIGSRLEVRNSVAS